ncbi:Bro-N domain-containing protein [Kitasatospora sp. NBC_01539]|uniref:BRO-N domain-containing protein n=1 Tax=Kitasatospora sp. NBC_01539 TaxID=2903577 RepID=UPI00386028BC
MTTNDTPALFDFHGREVRVITRDGEPWWVAADVCAVLEIANPRDALRKVLDDDERGVATVYTPGGDQQVSVINEPGLYSLVLRSRKPQAKAFKRWVTHEVIPRIRRTGRYAVADSRQQDVPSAMADFLRLIAGASAEALVHAGRTAAAMDGTTRAVEGLNGRIADLAEVLATVAARLPAQPSGPDAKSPDAKSPGSGGGAGADGGPEEPIWHAGIPEEALPFDTLAELLAVELGRPGLSRGQLYATACDAGLLRQLPPPYGGHSLTDPRLASLFLVRRTSGALHGWPTVHHHQPMALPQGVVIMRQLVLQDIGRRLL